MSGYSTMSTKAVANSQKTSKAAKTQPVEEYDSDSEVEDY